MLNLETRKELFYVSDGEAGFLVSSIDSTRAVIENNDWHVNETVFDHTFRVLLYLLSEFSDNSSVVIEYIHTVVDNRTIANLLLIATILHDLGKVETWSTDGVTTKTPGHEVKSAEMCTKILQELNLTSSEYDFVINIIRYHGIFSDVINPENQNYQSELLQLKEVLNDAFLSVAILGKADLRGCQWGDTNPSDYQVRLERCTSILRA